MSEPLLRISGLNAYYGQAHILEGVELEMGVEAVSVIGRNGMGKTTLCNAIMGLMPRAEGSVAFRGKEILGSASYRIASAGIGYVPQGRRLFQSLTVDEHLRMLASGTRGKQWTPARIYELFPRLAERKKIGGHAAFGRRAADARDRPRAAHEPRPPDHGRAVRGSRADDRRERDRDDQGRSSTREWQLLLVEQNLGVATSVAVRQLVMVVGADRGGDDRRGAPRRSRRPAALSRRRAARRARLTRARVW